VGSCIAKHEGPNKKCIECLKRIDRLGVNGQTKRQTLGHTTCTGLAIELLAAEQTNTETNRRIVETIGAPMHRQDNTWTNY
jgi:hypothetical protein